MRNIRKARIIAHSDPDSRSIRVIISMFALLLACTSLGADEAKPARHPNVLLIVSDDQRPDTIRALGNAAIETPHLDSMVRAGTVMRRAVSPNPICHCSRAEMLTGCSGFRNGVFDGGQLNPQLKLWPQAMRDAGYLTWYVGKWHNDGRPATRGYIESQGLFASGGGQWAKDETDWKGRPITGYKGWVFQSDDGKKFPERGVGLTPDISVEFAEAAISFIRRKPEQPFFLHVNFTAPHDPLFMPTGYAGKYVADKMLLPGNFLAEHPFDHGNFRGRDEELLPWPRTPRDVREELAYYYAVITHMDAQIGRMLAALDETGQAANTLVIFTSDQGVAIGSHGLRGKQNMYEHTIGVPLVMRGPGIPGGRICDAQVYLRDLFPTVCELTGLSIPETVEARSFAPVLSGKIASIHPHVFCYFRDVQRMIRTDRWKLIHYPKINRTQLFDVVNDPLERADASSETKHISRVTELRELLRREQKQAGDPVVTK